MMARKDSSSDTNGNSSPWRRRAIWIGAGVVALLLLYLALRPSRVSVESAVVARGPLAVSLTAEARTRVRDRYTLVAPVTGTLERVTLDPGDVISDDGEVARIRPATSALLDPRTRADAIARRDAAAARLQQARVVLQGARGDRDFAVRELERVRALAAAGALAPRELEQAERALDAAQSSLAAAEGAVRSAESELAAARIAVAPPQSLGSSGTLSLRAPAGGQVLRILARGPGLIAAGSPVIELGDAGSLEIVADLLTQDAVNVAAGAPASIVTGDGEIPARVRRVEPSAVTKISALGVEEQRVDVILDFVAGDGASRGLSPESSSSVPRGARESGTTANSPAALLASLGDGFRVDARIELARRENALHIPTSALFRDGSGWSTFVIEDGKARRRSIQVGIRGEQSAEVIEGLQDGEVVILYPGDEVREGARVSSGR